MSIVAVMNRKGGSGRSTLAVHLAARCAHKGATVLLGDTDKQLATQAWLGRRSPTAARISPWSNDMGRSLWTMEGHQHLVVDTPSGVHGLELAKHLARVDAVVVPVGPSLFDLETSTGFVQELLQHPRVVGGRCHVAVVGMRWSIDVLGAWASGDVPRPLPMLAIIPDAPIYRLALDRGSSLFDETSNATAADLLHWQPLLDWLDQLPMRADPIEGRAGAEERSAPEGVLRGQGSRPAASRVTELRSPAAFVETQPPFDVDAAGPDDLGHHWLKRLFRPR